MSNSFSNLITPTPSQERENSYLFRPISPAISVWEPELSPQNNRREDDNRNINEEEEDPFGNIEISYSFDEWDDEALSPLSQQEQLQQQNQEEEQPTLKYKPNPRRHQDENDDNFSNDDYDSEDDSYGSIKITYSFDEWDQEENDDQQPVQPTQRKDGEGSNEDIYGEDDNYSDGDDTDPYDTIKHTYSFDEWNEPPLRRLQSPILKKKATTSEEKAKNIASVFRFDQWDGNDGEEYDEDSDNAAKFLTKCTSTTAATTTTTTQNRYNDLAIQPSNTTLSSKWDIYRAGDSPGAFQPVVKASFDKDKLTPLDTWSSSYIDSINDKHGDDDDGIDDDVLPPATLTQPCGSIPCQEQPKSAEKSQRSSSSWQHVDIPPDIEIRTNYNDSDQHSVASPSSCSSSSYPEFKFDATVPSSQPPSIPDFVLLHQALALEQPPLQRQPRQQQRKSWCQKSMSKFFASRGRRTIATIQSEL